MEKENTIGQIVVTVLSDGTALVDIPKGVEADHETLKRVCDIIKAERKAREVLSA